MSAESDNGSGAGWEAPATLQPAPAGPTGPSALVDEHPEAIAGAAFVGGLLTALIVRRLGR